VRACAEVVESLLSMPATREAWLLGFLTGSALTGELTTPAASLLDGE
jgi:hypothetical protein